MNSSTLAAIRPRATLEWRDRTIFGRTTDIYESGQRVGSLAWPKWYSGAAIGETSVGEWRFGRRGFWSRRVFAQESGSTIDYSEIHLDFWKGEGGLTLNGKTYRLRRISFWRSEWAFEDHTGERVVTLRATRVVFRGRGSIETGRASGAENDLPFLVAFGLYILCMKQKDTAAAAAGGGG